MFAKWRTGRKHALMHSTMPQILASMVRSERRQTPQEATPSSRAAKRARDGATQSLCRSRTIASHSGFGSGASGSELIHTARWPGSSQQRNSSAAACCDARAGCRGRHTAATRGARRDEGPAADGLSRGPPRFARHQACWLQPLTPSRHGDIAGQRVPLTSAPAHPARDAHPDTGSECSACSMRCRPLMGLIMLGIGQQACGAFDRWLLHRQVAAAAGHGHHAAAGGRARADGARVGPPQHQQSAQIPWPLRVPFFQSQFPACHATPHWCQHRAFFSHSKQWS